MSGYFDDADGAEDPERLGDDALDDGRTPLDRTIDRIGMGACRSLCQLNILANLEAQARISGHCSRYAVLVRSVTGKCVLEDLHDD